MMTLEFIIAIAFIILIAFYVFLFMFEKKINKLEEITLHVFKEKNNLIPGIYEISKPHIQKHDDVFKNIMTLRKTDFSENLITDDFYKIIQHQQHFHKEINFIFRLSMKHKKLVSNGNFLYLRDIMVEKSSQIGEYIELYKHISKRFNKLIKIKNLTLIGLFIPITYKIEI